ncbi:pyruvate carboxylase [Aestuariimicrobium sp. p3-SID1156]|uniref:pyruvate carboxylase n=1 Tax=Aestuariimicrobium sp. p3-SID1156 TaxID=2916038 RepID=UPI00223BAD49|nr:pyruvate carboxylase [Aestuariimicrobium sp. p3-SID1156]MCT1458447.1 pyruvate carboxylase [Aestuariimicrobium sp. p3-SID1156]
MFSKVLVANRGEIAVRAFRAAYELGARTVAVFPHEDRAAEHRIKADEAYQIGEKGHPVSAYLDIAEIIRAAKESGADAVYPGYGFLSENPDLAEACAANGLTFIGPSAQVLELAGNKVRAIDTARKAGLPTLKSSEPGTDVDTLIAEADEIGFPVFVKAVAGGGGRGMRLVQEREDLPEALDQAMREANGAFGDPTVFIEQAVQRPRHIEVQVLGDTQGNVIHLFERDCSIQRRHQKVIEMAPARNLDPELRDKLCADAVKFAQSINYSCAGTVEFLVETAGPRAGEYVFIEMNPRIQVEHTVTEEVTDVDLVQAQMRIASGESLADLGLNQDDIQVRGVAIQARITTEDASNGFRPDTGVITAYRSASGAGIRLDGGTVATGVEVQGYFDSLLVKVTAHARDFDGALNRLRRALAEFRIRGVSTNIPFLRAVLDDKDFDAGNTSTHFIDERPYLLTSRAPADRGTKMLRWLADVTVNKPNGEPSTLLDPSEKLPAGIDLNAAAPAGSKQRLDELGPAGWAAWLRESDHVEVTDTTFRDAHQSLLATRVRTRDLLAVAPYEARMLPELLSVECWGGATYDVALRFLGEDPWERLGALREAMPNMALQMLLRGRNTVGYTPYPTQVTEAFVEEAARTGVDVFRIFDALNDVDQMRPAIEAVLSRTESVAEVALCYTSNLMDPGETTYNLDFYLRLAEQIVEAGAHVLAIKDMAGLLRPPAAEKLVRALRERFDLPVHLHTHDTAGGQTATLLRAIDAGVDAVDVACAAMAGTTSQPPASALVMALEHGERQTRLNPRAVADLEPYWEAVRRVYVPFESGLASPTGRVYHHEIPGGQLSNLRQQAIALGLGDRFEQIEATYAAANKILGRPTKVTPSSKVVGDLALHLVAVNADPAEFEADPQKFDIPDSVIGFLNGELGTPAGGWPEPFRSKALAGRQTPLRQTEVSEGDAANLREPGRDRQVTLNRLLFPAPTKEFDEAREEYGDLTSMPTIPYLYGMRPGEEHVITIDKGVSLITALEAISEPDTRAKRTVMTLTNGQLRPVRVRDKSIKAEVASAERADKNNPGHVAAPYAGAVTVRVSEGDHVNAGDSLAVIEAMKMEASINAPVSGTVERVVLSGTFQAEGGDLVAVLAPDGQ